MPNIDAHVHFWKYDKKRDTWITPEMKILQRDYVPDDLMLNLKRNDIDGCIAVQASQSELETLFLVELAASYPMIKGVVGWIDLQADNLEERLQYFSQFPIIKGYRHIVQAEPEKFLVRPGFMRGLGLLKGYSYSYDLLIYPHQLPDAIELISKFPEQPFVLDHCAKPAIRNNDIKEWKASIQELAKAPAVSCKLSGLLTEAHWKGWSAADFYPYLDVVFEAFGTGRLLFGSDWPVMLLSGMYVQWKSLVEKYMQQFSADDREKVFGLNAGTIYSL